MTEQQKRVVTNFDLIGYLGGDEQSYAFTRVAQDWKTYLKQCANADLVIIDNDAAKVYLACLMQPFCRFSSGLGRHSCCDRPGDLTTDCSAS